MTGREALSDPFPPLGAPRTRPAAKLAIVAIP